MSVATSDPIWIARLRLLLASGEGRRLRLEGKVSLSEVARAVGSTPTGVMRWERGERLPRESEAALRYYELLCALRRTRSRRKAAAT